MTNPKTKTCSRCKKKSLFGRSLCRKCYNENRRKRYKKDSKYRARCKKTSKKYIKSPKGKVHRRKWKKNGRIYLAQRKHHLKRDYGLTLEQYDQMLDEQNGVCIICKGINANGRRLAVDHNHQTGKIRGLLCDCCNLWLGKYETNHSLFEKFDEYLKKIE